MVIEKKFLESFGKKGGCVTCSGTAPHELAIKYERSKSQNIFRSLVHGMMTSNTRVSKVTFSPKN
jgi:hypothetical protein